MSKGIKYVDYFQMRCLLQKFPNRFFPLQQTKLCVVPHHTSKPTLLRHHSKKTLPKRNGICRLSSKDFEGESDEAKIFDGNTSLERSYERSFESLPL